MKSRKIKIVLAGDSFFDNQAYVKENESVSDIISAICPEVFVEKLAVDGAKVADIQKQIANLSLDFSALYISAGGNNALALRKTLQEEGISRAFNLINEALFKFKLEYQSMLQKAVSRFGSNRIKVFCLYTSIPNLTIDEINVLNMFNNCIRSTAKELGVITWCSSALLSDNADFSLFSNLEPSEIGGLKIAGCIQQHIEQLVLTAV